MVDINNTADISPASINSIANITWSDKNKPKDTILLNNTTMKFEKNESDKFRYIESNEVFNKDSGIVEVRLKAKFNIEDYNSISIGINTILDKDTNSNVFFHKGGLYYCNFYPLIARDTNNIHTIKPPVFTEDDEFYMIIDCKSQNIKMSINEKEIINTDIGLGSVPFHIRVGMYEGTVEII